MKEEGGSKFYYLYNDKKDPYQIKNLWGKNPKRDQKINLELTDLLKKMNDSW